jgi:hypothetical protein
LKLIYEIKTVYSGGSTCEVPTLKIFFESGYGDFFFQWKDLHSKHVDLDTVLYHYFEHCFLEVPLRIMKSLPGDPEWRDEEGNVIFFKASNLNTAHDYEEIVKYYESSLSFAMSQHKRLGQACQYWDLPDTCLALIHLLLRPQFGKLP